MTTESEKTQQGVRSVESGMRVVTALTRSMGAMSLKDLALAADMPASKAHRYVVSLIRTGMVEQDEATGRYDLGPAALELGLAALGRLDMVKLGTTALKHLQDEIDETVALAIWGNRGPTIVRWIEASRPVTVNVRLGSVMPLLCSAIGRCFLAYMPRARIKDMIDHELADPDCGIAGPDQVDALIAQVRRHGLGRVQGDLLPGVASLSAPVFDQQNDIVAVLAALGPERGFNADYDGAIADALRSVAGDISAHLGYRGPAK